MTKSFRIFHLKQNRIEETNYIKLWSPNTGYVAVSFFFPPIFSWFFDSLTVNLFTGLYGVQVGGLFRPQLVVSACVVSSWLTRILLRLPGNNNFPRNQQGHFLVDCLIVPWQLRLDFNPHTPNWGSSPSYGLPPMHLCWHNRWREEREGDFFWLSEVV